MVVIRFLEFYSYVSCGDVLYRYSYSIMQLASARAFKRDDLIETLIGRNIISF